MIPLCVDIPHHGVIFSSSIFFYEISISYLPVAQYNREIKKKQYSALKLVILINPNSTLKHFRYKNF